MKHQQISGLCLQSAHARRHVGLIPAKISLQGSWELQTAKVWKAMLTLSMNDFMVVKGSILC